MNITKKMKRLVVSTGFLLLIMSAFSQDPNFYIFLCFGQSNMEGQGPIESQDQTVDSRFRVMEALNCSNLGRTQGSWYTAVPPLVRCNTNLSPADYFGRTMVANLPSNIKVGIINVSVAGCKIELFDKANYASYVAGEAQWMKDIIAEYGGNPYGRLVEMAKLAQQDGVIKGILMHQGESNTGDTQWPGKVNGVYTNLLADLGLTAANVPFLAGEVVDAAQGGQCASMNTIIATLPNTIPTAHVISSSGCTDQSDNLHFTSAGYRLLGERYALKMLELLDPVTGTPSVSITSPTANASFAAPASITISATATDSDGTISKVEFFNGTVKLGESTTAPYTFTWAGVEAGRYTIKAVATDNENNSSSASVAVTVSGQSVDGDITIRALGIVGDETIELEVDGVVVDTWTLSTSYANYTATANVNGIIRVNYTNDDGADRDVQIDYIVVAGTTYEAEDQAVNTGYYANGACGGGGNSELMHCSGYIEFETNPVVVVDNCPNDPNKLEPGTCGCGNVDVDSDSDGTADCLDECPNDAEKISEGFCGCGVTEGSCVVMELPLRKGWNLIGCPISGTNPLDENLSSIWQYVDMVKNMEGYYSKFQPVHLNSLTELKYGHGYFINVTQACTLVW